MPPKKKPTPAKRPSKKGPPAKLNTSAPIAVSERGLRDVYRWVDSGDLLPETRALWLASPEKERLRRLRSVVEEIVNRHYQEVLRKRATERRNQDRERAAARRAAFMASWRAAEAFLENLRVDRVGLLERSREVFEAIRTANKERAPSDDDVSKASAAMDEIEQNGQLERDLEAAMTEATSGLRALAKTLDRFAAGAKWAMASRVAAAYRDGRGLASVARDLGVECAALELAMKEHEGDRSSDGPMKAAYRVVGKLAGRHPRTVAKPPAVGAGYFLRWAEAEVGDQHLGAFLGFATDRRPLMGLSYGPSSQDGLTMALNQAQNKPPRRDPRDSAT